MIKTLVEKLNRMFTAMACAEGGDLDTVKDILREGKKSQSPFAADEACKGELADAS